jgi:hypothetical protein
MDPRYVSGAVNLNTSRPVSQATQEYTSDQKEYPLNQPVQKIEALVRSLIEYYNSRALETVQLYIIDPLQIQCSGEAEYSEDVASFKREVFAAYVTSSVAVADIDSINTTDALVIKLLKLYFLFITNEISLRLF